MKKLVIASLLLVFCISSSANVVRPVAISEISVSGEGKYKDQFNLSFQIKYRSMDEAEISGVSLSMLYGTYVSKQGALKDIVNPKISNLRTLNDAGVNGTHYRFLIEYGYPENCGEKKILEITQPFKRDAKNLEIKTIQPCSEDS